VAGAPGIICVLAPARSAASGDSDMSRAVRALPKRACITVLVRAAGLRPASSASSGGCSAARGWGSRSLGG
jgi:hypothetical protein